MRYQQNLINIGALNFGLFLTLKSQYNSNNDY
jgi:hypothetical protein